MAATGYQQRRNPLRSLFSRVATLAGLAAGNVTVAAGGVVTGDAELSPSSLARTYAEEQKDRFSVLRYIPKQYHATIRDYTSSTDISAHMQLAIDDVSAQGGGDLYFPAGKYLGYGLIQKAGVALLGAGRWYLSGSRNITLLEMPAVDGTLISDDGVGAEPHFPTIRNMNLQGSGALTNRQRLIHYQYGRRPVLDGLFLRNATLEAIRIEANARYARVSNIDAFGAQSSTVANAENVGAVYFDCAECQLHFAEIGAVPSATSGTPADGALYHRALWLGPNAADCMIGDVLVENADIGCLIEGSLSHLVRIIADGNFGHGIVIADGSAGNPNHNTLVSPRGSRNSRYLTNTYDFIRVTSTAGDGNLVTGATCTTGGTWPGSGFGAGTFQHRYGYYDAGPDVSSVAIGNAFLDCSMPATDAGTKIYNPTTANKGGFRQRTRGTRTISTSSSTISIDASSGTFFRLTGTGVTWNAITNGADGDEIVAQCVTAGGVLISNQTTFKLRGNAGTRTLYGLEIVRFRNIQGVWYEVGGHSPTNGVNTRSDADVAMSAISADIQQLTVPITADRTMTLPTVSQIANGRVFTFRRTAAATGAFNWKVAGLTSGTANLAVGEWLDAYCDQSATWYLLRRGNGIP